MRKQSSEACFHAFPPSVVLHASYPSDPRDRHRKVACDLHLVHQKCCAVLNVAASCRGHLRPYMAFTGSALAEHNM